MNNEFEKLDIFMKEHAPPQLTPVGSLSVKNENHWLLKGALALGLCAIVVVTASQNQKNKVESTLALSEALQWDVTTDEMPVEIEDTLALLE